MNLKPKYKEVILLFYYQDMKISEIARVLDAPESVSYTHLCFVGWRTYNARRADCFH